MKRDIKTIAVDFDGCLCVDEYPSIGAAHKGIIDDLIYRRRDLGCKIILWTCREGDLLHQAIGWCHAFGLDFDAVNENLPENVAQYANDCRKVYADEYWDDRALIVRGGKIA